MAVWDNWDSVRDFRADSEHSRLARENRTWRQSLVWVVALTVVILTLWAGMRPAHAAVENVRADCDSASGVAAPFVHSVIVNGEIITQESVTGRPVPRTGGEWWSWRIDLVIEGDQVIVIEDTTRDGAERHRVAEVAVSCPVATTLAEPSTTTMPEPTMPEPTLVIDPAPETTIPAETAPTTSPPLPGGVELLEPTTSAPLIPAVPPGDEATTSTSTTNTLPATGAGTATFSAIALGFVVLGVACIIGTRRRVCR